MVVIVVGLIMKATELEKGKEGFFKLRGGGGGRRG
jgi:hypothetical protein